MRARPFDFLQSRLGRRILLLFVACALLPAGIAALAIYSQTRAHLLEEARADLRLSAKQLGLLIYERLRNANEVAFAQVREADDPSWLARVGQSLVPGALDDRSREHLIRGGTLVHVDVEHPNARALLLIRGNPDRPAALHVARLSATSLWRTPEENLLGEGEGFCVIGHDGAALHCSDPALVRATLDGTRTTLGGRAMLLERWSIFLRPAFGVEPWTVVLAVPRATVLAPIAALRRGFPLLVLLALGVGLLLALPQIRANLGPLRALTEMAPRIAARDFDARVAIASRDEFELLGSAFNSMAGELGQQFQTLEVMGEIDRSVLGALDLGEIATAVLRQLPRITRSRDAALLVWSADPNNAQVRIYRAAGGAATPARAIELEPAVRQWIDALEQDRSLECAPEALRAFAADLGGRPERSFALPLRARASALGALLIAWPDDAELADPAALRRLVDQVAVAVSNARLVEEIQFLAYYDGLTQLANRQLGRERLAQAIARARRHGDGVAVIFLDVDRFKRVNDSLGHAAGDELLRVIARRLSQALRGSDSIARAADELGSLSRQGGDEFIAVLPEIRDPLAVAAVARRIVEGLGEPIPLQGQELHVTVSAGIALYPHDGETPEELIKNADAAMYDAKSSGRDAVRFYRAEMNAEATRMLTVQARLRKALEAGGLDVAFQPIAACADGRIVGMEALVRWTDAELGPVSPLELISVAEESGLIEALGDEILEVACRRAVALWLEREDVPSVSVNVSARQFASPGFAARVGEILRRSGLPPERLVLEITESVMLRRGSDPLATMAALKELGVRIAIDDFGTGYSSLGYLKAFPVDVLKIDRSFVVGIGEDPRDEAIASAIVELGHLLGLRVTAEGVQTEQQFHFLRARGCDSIQGYLLAKPALAGDLPEALERAQRTAADLTQRTPTYQA